MKIFIAFSIKIVYIIGVHIVTICTLRRIHHEEK